MARPAMQRELNVSFSGSKKMQRVNQSKFDAMLAVFNAAGQMRVENATRLAKAIVNNFNSRATRRNARAVVQTAGRGYDYILEMSFVNDNNMREDATVATMHVKQARA